MEKPNNKEALDNMNAHKRLREIAIKSQTKWHGSWKYSQFEKKKHLDEAEKLIVGLHGDVAIERGLNILRELSLPMYNAIIGRLQGQGFSPSR